MEFDKSTNRREITIKGVVLKVISPFAEGHVLTAEQANVLNQTLAENLRNNFAGVVEAAKEAGEPDVAALQKELNEYTKGYEFGKGRQAGAAVDPVTKIAISLARDAVKKALVAQGKSLKDYTAETLATMAARVVETNPKFRDLAAQQYEIKKSSTSESLGDLAA